MSQQKSKGELNSHPVQPPSFASAKARRAALSQSGCPVHLPKFGSATPPTVEAMHDVLYPAVPFPSNRVFAVAGEAKIRELVGYHHDLLRISPVKHLFESTDLKFARLVKRTADFFVEMFGGPAYFTPEQGAPNLRTRHFPFTISEKDRLVWLDRFEQALVETEFPAQSYEEVWNWVEPLSIRMINRRTTTHEVERLEYQTRARLTAVANIASSNAPSHRV